MNLCTLVQIAIVASIALASGLVRADQTGKPPVIGQVLLTPPTIAKPYLDAFKDGLRELGYVEGQNVLLVAQHANGDVQKLEGMVREMVARRVDVLIVTSAAVRPALAATRTIPILCTSLDDAIGLGLVASLAKPGGNLTGLTGQLADTDSKRLQLALEANPNIKHGVILFDLNYPAAKDDAAALRLLAQQIGVSLRTVGVRQLDDMETAIREMETNPPQLLIAFGTPLTFERHERIVNLSSKGVAVVTEGREWAEAGALLTYAPDFLYTWRRLASYADKVLKGAKAGDLPIEQPTEFDLYVNLRTAKALRLTIPDSILVRAKRVFR